LKLKVSFEEVCLNEKIENIGFWRWASGVVLLPFAFWIFVSRWDFCT
jgi:hypothetical protein